MSQFSYKVTINNIINKQIREKTMKKFITAAVILVFSTFSANALDLSFLSLTGGIASNNSVFAASGKAEKQNEQVYTTGAEDTGLDSTSKKSGIFQDGFGSQFVELGLGKYVSIGFDHASESMVTPENVTNEGESNQATVSASFNNLDTTYVKLNLPKGIYLTYGNVDVDVDVRETVGSGNTYADVSLSGTTSGIGWQTLLGDTGFGFRFQGNYVDLGSAVTTNGVTHATQTTTTGGKQTVTISNIEGATAKIALTYTFGREGNY